MGKSMGKSMGKPMGKSMGKPMRKSMRCFICSISDASYVVYSVLHMWSIGSQ